MSFDIFNYLLLDSKGMMSSIKQTRQVQFDQHDPLLDIVSYGLEVRHFIDYDLVFALEKTQRKIAFVQQDVDDADCA